MRPTKRTLLVCVSAFVMLAAPSLRANAADPAATDSTALEPPERPTLSAPEQTTPRSETEVEARGTQEARRPSGTTGIAAGPVVHVINMLPDDDRGVLKLVQHRDTVVHQGPSAVVVTSRFLELCNEPCGRAVDVSERPLFYFVRDGKAVSKAFRLPAADEVTLRVRPARSNMHYAGMVTSMMGLLPVGIPLWIIGRPVVWISDGPPEDGQPFRRLERARV